MIITAVIPARGGSKRIIGKNKKNYCGKPLLVHSIEQALDSKYINRVIVSTDDDEIAEIASNASAIVIKRPADISHDTSTDLQLFQHIMEYEKNNNGGWIETSMFVHLRPTYPNRNVSTIDECIKIMLNNKIRNDSLRSVIPNTSKTPFKMYVVDKNYLAPVVEMGHNSRDLPTQLLPQTYIHNGYIDIVWANVIRDQLSMSGSFIHPYIMDENECHDIDIMDDWIRSEMAYREVYDKEIKLGNKIVGKNYPCFIIAEAGINHNGSVENAKKLIDMAVRCKVDCVKFQKRTISRILTRRGLNEPYVNDRSFGPTYGDHKRALELSFADFEELMRYCNKVGMMMTASGWDEESIDFLYKLGVPFFKMASADLTNFPLLEYTAKKGLPMIISTGMSDMDTVERAYELVSQFNNNIIILQCTSSYPTENKDVNLRVIDTYKNKFPNAIIGFSGHERGIAISTASVAIGAKVVERHFTLDRTMKGGDHAASLEEPGLFKLVRDIRVVESAMGYGVKRMMESERGCYRKLAKSIVTAVPIKKGDVITRNMLTTKGPGYGINPMRMNEIIGSIATVNIDEDEVLEDVMIKLS